MEGRRVDQQAILEVVVRWLRRLRSGWLGAFVVHRACVGGIEGGREAINSASRMGPVDPQIPRRQKKKAVLAAASTALIRFRQSANHTPRPEGRSACGQGNIGK